MSYSAYAEYKDSGVEWLNKIPAHWKIKPLKHSSLINAEVLPETTDDEFEFEYIDIGSVSTGSGLRNTESMKFANAPSRARRLVKNGDVIVSTVRTYLRAIAPIRDNAENFVVSTGFCVVSPIGNLHSGYCSYLLQSPYFVETVVAGSVGVSYPATNSTDIANIQVPLPDNLEQTQIANFLDRETAKIDTLIDKQQQLIKLLQEKRQAVISHAVTKGLNPDAKMKNSGVEWLGEVPEGWEVAKLKHLVRELESGVSVNAADYPKEENEIGVLKTSCVYTRQFRPLEHKTVFSEEIDRVKCPVRYGAIIVSRMNTPDLVGAAAYVSSNYERLYLPDRLWQTVFYDENKQHPKYLHYFMYLRGFRDQIANYAEGASSSMQNIAKEDFLSIDLTVPPIYEQTQIANFLDRETSKIDVLIEKSRIAVDLLQERRTALISAAVTGKIDVRNATQ